MIWAEAGTSWILWLHDMTTPITPADPISLDTVRSWTASLVESHCHWNTHSQKSQSLPGPDQLQSPVHWKQKIHPSSSRTQQSRTTNTRVTSNTTCTTNGEVRVTIQNNISTSSYIQDYLAMTMMTTSTSSKTNRWDALTRQIYYWTLSIVYIILTVH